MTHLSYVINELYSVHATIRMLFLYHLNRIRCLFRIIFQNENSACLISTHMERRSFQLEKASISNVIYI